MMQLTLAGLALPPARAAAVAKARCLSRSTKLSPRNEPTPSRRKSRRLVPSQFRVGSDMRGRAPRLSLSSARSMVEHELRGVDQGPQDVFRGRLSCRSGGGEGFDGNAG